MILSLTHADSSIDFSSLFGENGVFLVLNDWLKDQEFALKQSGAEKFHSMSLKDFFERHREGLITIRQSAWLK
jgi:hypothetical protein